MEVIKIKKKVNHSDIYANKMRVAAYVRVSTKRDLQFNSFESQINYYTDLINKNSNWVLHKIYSDFGKSGTSLDGRDSFIEMVNDAMNGKIDFIITKSVSRFARNTEILLKVVRNLKQKNIGVYFEEERINTFTIDGEFLLSVLSSVAQIEAENLRSHITTAFRQRMEMGINLHKVRTYGYEYIDGEITVVQEEAKVIKEIYEMYLNGNSTAKIKKYLDDNNIPTLKGKKWNEGTIYQILKNSMYTGDLAQGRDRSSKIEKLYIIKDHHEPIISRETYNKVQEKFKRCAKQFERKFSYNIVRCNECGFKTPCVYDGNHAYLRCQRTGCKTHQIRKELFEEQFTNFLINFIELQPNTSYKNDLVKINNLIDKYNKEKVYIFDEYTDKKINSYIYKSRLESINKELVKLQKKLDKNEKYLLFEKKGKKIQEEVIKKIIDYSDDINVFNQSLFEKICEFVLYGNTRKGRVIKYFYKKDDELFNLKIDDYLEYQKKFELLYSHKEKISLREGRGKLKEQEMLIEFYIRKD